jgi:hypothetical protein
LRKNLIDVLLGFSERTAQLLHHAAHGLAVDTRQYRSSIQGSDGSGA